MPEAGNEQQCLVLNANADPALASTGLRFISVEHDGCSQKSEPEADRVCELYQSLLAQHWTGREGVIHRIEVNSCRCTPVQGNLISEWPYSTPHDRVTRGHQFAH
jgi:hypothetical protein